MDRTYDGLLTVLAECEMILNSIPLTYIESETSEEPLTPSHLIIGYRVMNLPSIESDTSFEDEFNPTKSQLHDRMRYLNVKLNHFWKRWRNEYLVELRNAHRHSPITHGHGVSREIRVGEVVMVQMTTYPEGSGSWRL